MAYKVALLTFKVRNTSTPSYLRRLIQDREHGHKLRSITTTPCQPFKTTTFAKRAFRCSAPAVWNSLGLPQTVLYSDPVAVFKSRLKTFLFLSGFLFFLCSLTRCLASAPLKLRLYGAIQICLLFIIIIRPIMSQLSVWLLDTTESPVKRRSQSKCWLGGADSCRLKKQVLDGGPD